MRTKRRANATYKVGYGKPPEDGTRPTKPASSRLQCLHHLGIVRIRDGNGHFTGGQLYLFSVNAGSIPN